MGTGLERASVAAKYMGNVVAVKPGAVLLDERFLWPMKDLTGWSPLFVRRLDGFLPKLAVLQQEAIPISVVNLRSAVQSEEAKQTEGQLKLLTIERLSREPRLFVLERQRMELLGEEKALKSDESAFWEDLGTPNLFEWPDHSLRVRTANKSDD